MPQKSPHSSKGHDSNAEIQSPSLPTINPAATAPDKAAMGDPSNQKDDQKSPRPRLPIAPPIITPPTPPGAMIMETLRESKDPSEKKKAPGSAVKEPSSPAGCAQNERQEQMNPRVELVPPIAPPIPLGMIAQRALRDSGEFTKKHNEMLELSDAPSEGETNDEPNAGSQDQTVNPPMGNEVDPELQFSSSEASEMQVNAEIDATTNYDHTSTRLHGSLPENEDISTSPFTNHENQNHEIAFERNEVQSINMDSVRTVEIPEAFLVNEESTGRFIVEVVDNRSANGGPVVSAHAKPLRPWWKKKRTIFLLAALVILIVVVIVGVKSDRTIVIIPTEVPSSSPSQAPSYDQRPTFDIVQSRGELRCGIIADQLDRVECLCGFTEDLCRSLASVVLGSIGKDKVKFESVTEEDRFLKLDSRKVDLLLSGDTYTIRREISEESTGKGLSFSSPYHHSVVAFIGLPMFVKCAEEYKRYDECSDLTICVPDSTTVTTPAVERFPTSFIRIEQSHTDAVISLENGDCNVVLAEKYRVVTTSIWGQIESGHFVIGNVTQQIEPLAVVTRKDDSQWSGIVNSVINAIILGNQTGMTKDPSRCMSKTTVTNPENLDFMNAIYCVGNYGEIYSKYFVDSARRTNMNFLNEGSALINAPPFGSLDGGFPNPNPNSTIEKIVQRGHLNCGIFHQSCALNESSSVEGKSYCMEEIYCRALAVALFHGNPDAVNLTTFDDWNSTSIFEQLSREVIDVVAGGRVNLKDSVESFTPDGDRVVFSIPYYYKEVEGNENEVEVIALVTLERDVLFSSFVNTIVVATINAVKMDIGKEKSEQMPLISLFGPNFRWALRDAISFSGNYNEIYKASCNSSGDNIFRRGRNEVNIENGPQLFPLPGVDVSHN